MAFPESTCAFLSDLAQNNDRDWFEANKERYKTDWLNPATRFVSALSSHMSGLKPPHKAEARINGSIRRLNRDTRFGRDKTPYDPKLHLVFWTGDHPNRSPAIHIVLHADRLGLGAGQFSMTATELDCYRRTLTANATARGELVDVLSRLGDSDCTLTEETLKRVPKGFDVPTEDETLLKRKSLVARTSATPWHPATLCDDAKLMAFCGLAAELNNWLCENITQG